MTGAEIDVALKDVSGGRVAWVTVHNPARLNILNSNNFLGAVTNHHSSTFVFSVFFSLYN